MADLPDYYTQAQISEAEAASFKGGLEANRSLTPVSRDIYFGTDNHVLYVCVADGFWTGFDASILTQGILTLYANMLGGGFQIKNIADPTVAQDAATRAYVLAQDILEAAARDAAILVETNARIAADALRLLLTGGAMTGNIAMGTNRVTGLSDPLAAQDAATKAYADLFTLLATFNNHKARLKDGGADEISLAGLAGESVTPQPPKAHTLNSHTAPTADISMNSHKITNLLAPTAAGHALRKGTAQTTTELPALTTGKIWQGVANRPSEADLAGDMLKATYDPDEDGKIALAQLVNAVCSETEAAALVTKEFFVPVLTGDLPDYRGVYIDAGGETAYLMLLVPHDFTALTSLEIIFLPTNTEANMHFTFNTYFGAYNGGEDNNAGSETEANRDIGATIALQNKAHDIADLVTGLAAGDILGIKITYSATVVVSKAQVRGVRLKYS